MRNERTPHGADRETCGDRSKRKRDREGDNPRAGETQEDRERDERSNRRNERRLRRRDKVENNAEAEENWQPRRQSRGFGFGTERASQRLASGPQPITD